MRKNQKGAVLLFTLIVLTAALLSMVALMRSTGAGNLITGSLAFKDSAMHEAFVGLNQAMATIKTCGSSCTFISNTQMTDAQLLNKTTWASSQAQTVTSTVPGYKIQYIIDRLSNASLVNMHNSTDVKQNSLGFVAYDTSTMSNFSEAGMSSILSAASVFYRITARVEGPDKTLYIVQVTATIGVS